jgi:hypothetical protein
LKQAEDDLQANLNEIARLEDIRDNDSDSWNTEMEEELTNADG